jgi:hypothetical protein
MCVAIDLCTGHFYCHPRSTGGDFRLRRDPHDDRYLKALIQNDTSLTDPLRSVPPPGSTSQIQHLSPTESVKHESSSSPKPGRRRDPAALHRRSLLRAITQNNNVFGLGGGITAAVMLVLVGRALDWRRELAAAVPAPMPH